MVAGDIRDARDGFHLLDEDCRPVGKLGRVGIGQGVLILRLCQTCADGDVLGGLHIESDALDPGKLRPQPVDDLVCADVALTAGLQSDEDTSLVEGRGRTAGADVVADRFNRRILQQNIYQRLLALGHRGKRDILRCLGDADDLPGILLREEAFGNDDVEIAGQRNGAEHHHQRDETVAQDDLQAMLIERQKVVEAAFEYPIEPPVLPVGFVLQQARAHHRRQGQRDDER